MDCLRNVSNALVESFLISTKNLLNICCFWVGGIVSWRKKLTKHADWQPLSRQVTKNLPICPICRKRTNWEVHDKYGWRKRGYRIICKLCGAEWEYTISKLSAKDILLGPGVIALYRVARLTKDDSIWILRKIGRNPVMPNADTLLDKEITFSTWKQMASYFCSKCGSALAEDEKFCPKCGTARD